MIPSIYLTIRISGGQQEEGHRVVHHVQEEHNQSTFLQSITGGPMLWA